MKSYEFVTHTKLGRTIKLVTYPDPKREGLYKTTEVWITNGKERKFSYFYGKSNQSEIQQLIAKSTEI
jgi:hypothetical protein